MKEAVDGMIMLKQMNQEIESSSNGLSLVQVEMLERFFVEPVVAKIESKANLSLLVDAERVRLGKKLGEKVNPKGKALMALALALLRLKKAASGVWSEEEVSVFPF